MDYRDRVINTVRFQPTDSLPFRHAYGLMPGVFERWHDEGLPASVKTTQELVRHNTPTLMTRKRRQRSTPYRICGHWIPWLRRLALTNLTVRSVVRIQTTKSGLR